MSLDSLIEGLSSLSDVGDCVAQVEHWLKKLKLLEEHGQVSSICPSGHLCLSVESPLWGKFLLYAPLQAIIEKAQLHALHGEQLIQSNHYAVDSIWPKCVELRKVCDDFSNSARKKTDVLSKSLLIHVGIDKVRAPPGSQDVDVWLSQQQWLSTCLRERYFKLDWGDSGGGKSWLTSRPCLCLFVSD